MLLTVLVPWRDCGCPYRRASFEKVVANLTAFFPGVYVTPVDDGGDLWSRGQSIDKGISDSGSDVFLVHDADALIPAEQLRTAVWMAIEAPGQVIPFTLYRYLDERTSAQALAADHIGSGFQWRAVWKSKQAVGGSSAFTRETHELAGGHDPRFRGWGAQDKQFWTACDTLVAPVRYVPGPYVHLWHPLDQTNDPSLSGYQANMVLRDRYFDAHGDPLAMRALVEEGAAFR